MQNTTLYKKIFGSLMGMAIGDAMGGPVEGWNYQQIEDEYGKLDEILPYEREPSVHRNWKKERGTYTDDTRLALLLCRAIINKQGVPTDKDLMKEYIDYYYNASQQIEKDWLEEYVLKAIYKDDKLVFGGQPTNGAIMMITPMGLINALRPGKAAAKAFEISFMVEGVTRESAAIAAAAVAGAMKPDTEIDEIINEALASIWSYKVDGERWQKSEMYKDVGQENQNAVNKAIEIAREYNDILKIRKPLYDNISRRFFADGVESLAVPLAMLVAADGDFKETVIGCVNYGKDNDSYASIGGGIAGAYHGIDAIPDKWIDTVNKANPEPAIEDMAIKLTKLVKRQADKAKIFSVQIEGML